MKKTDEKKSYRMRNFEDGIVNEFNKKKLKEKRN